MVDWAAVLDPKVLGLEGQVHSIATVERVDLSDVPYVEATVVLPEGIPDDRLTWDLVAPIHHAVRDAIANRIEVGYPHVRFITLEDLLSTDPDDPEFEDLVDADAAA